MSKYASLTSITCATRLLHHHCIQYMPVEDVVQDSSNLTLEVKCPAEFSFKPDQTYLSQLIKVFRITRKSQVGDFDQGLN